MLCHRTSQQATSQQCLPEEGLKLREESNPGRSQTNGQRSKIQTSEGRSRTSLLKGDFVSLRSPSPTINTDVSTGDKVKEQKEDAEREVENQRRAGSSYTSPTPGSIDQSRDLSGLPWGGISMRHIVETGRSREEKSQRSSRESSVYAAASSQTGGSSR